VAPGLWPWAALVLVTTGFETLGPYRIWATCDARNTASIALLEKRGPSATMEGEFRFVSPNRVALAWACVRL